MTTSQEPLDSAIGWVAEHTRRYVESDHPLWYLNLEDDPRVRVQVGAERFTARARTATADERARLWPRMASVWPAYDDYQRKTSRQIPVVVLERT